MQPVPPSMDLRVPQTSCHPLNRNKSNPSRATFPSADMAAPRARSDTLIWLQEHGREDAPAKRMKGKSPGPGAVPSALLCHSKSCHPEDTPAISSTQQHALLTVILGMTDKGPDLSSLLPSYFRTEIYSLQAPVSLLPILEIPPALPQSTCSQDPAAAASASRCQGEQPRNRRLQSQKLLWKSCSTT